MHTFIDKFNNLILGIRQKSFSFIYSGFLPLITSLIVFLFWIANLQIIGFLAIVLITSFVLIVYDDLLPIVSLMFMIPMSFRDTSVAFGNDLVYSIIIFSILVLSLIIHFIKYPMKNVVLDKFFFVLLSIIGMFFIGGLFSGNAKHYSGGVYYLLMSGIVPIAIHFFFYNKVKLNTNINIRKYLCISFIIAISLSAAQLCIVYLHFNVFDSRSFGTIPGNFCWANSNHIANLILIAVPLCCYMILSSKYVWAWFIELLFLYLTLYLSGSDGAFATLGVMTPFLMFVVYKNVYKYNLRITKFILSAIISIALICFTYVLVFDSAMLLDFFNSSANSTGRSLAYKTAVKSFLAFPIFGIGFGGGKASLDAVSHIHNYHGLYHSTFFHVLACAGIVGLICFLIYYLSRIKYLLHNDTVLGNFSFYAFIMFGLYGLIDNGEFNIVLMFMTTLITIVGLINKKGSSDVPLPLWIRIPKF